IIQASVQLPSNVPTASTRRNKFAIRPSWLSCSELTLARNTRCAHGAPVPTRLLDQVLWLICSMKLSSVLGVVECQELKCRYLDASDLPEGLMGHLQFDS
ncbi:hypothetical protein QR685DRAFT_432309, partial [Neurospora intermedia]